VADVDRDHERRPALGGRQSPGVRLGLAAGAQHRVVVSPPLGCLDVLRLEHEGAAPVEVDEADGLAAVAVPERNPPLEAVGVPTVVRLGRLGCG